MIDQLQTSFVQYGGKDSLVLVTTKGKSPPPVFSPLSTRGVPTCTLASLIESMKPQSAPIRDPTGDSNENKEDTTVGDAARKLQAFWRRRRPFLRSYRASLELTRGKESAFVFETIIKPSLDAIRRRHLQELNPNHGIDSDSVGESEDDEEESPQAYHVIPGILCKTIVLDTVGVDFYVALWKLRDDLVDANTLANTLSQRVLTDSMMKLSAVEELINSDHTAELNMIVKEVSKILGVKEVGKMYADPQQRWQELRRVFVGGRDTVEKLRVKLMGIVKTLERMLAGL